MSQINANPGTGGGGGGVELGGAQTGFTNGHVQFISQAGLQDGDDLFTFNSTTKEFFLQSNPGGTAGGFVNTQGTNSKFGWFDAASLIRGELAFSSSGNVLSFESNTMDDIHDALLQSNNLLGSGLPGSALVRYDTSTSELAVLGTTEQGGVIAIFGSTTNPDDTIATNMTMGANAAGGIRFTYEDTNTSQRSRFRMNTDDGNLWEFRPDILGDIETRLEQNNDILGLGAFSGSALTWSDSSTQIHAIVGAVDGTAAGLYPGSTLIATNNLATGASASIATNYDNVLNIATVIASAGNGDFDSGFEFDDGRMVVRYRNQTTGLDSAFEADATSAITRYTADGTTEWKTELLDGEFAFQNNTTGDYFLDVDNGITQAGLGDISGSVLGTQFRVNWTTGIAEMGGIDPFGNGTLLTVDDDALIITAKVNGTFRVIDTGSVVSFAVDTGNRQVIGGDTSLAVNGTRFLVSDVLKTIDFAAPLGVSRFGDPDNGGNGTTLEIDDDNQDIQGMFDGSFTLRNATNASDVGFYINYATREYWMGDINGINNGTFALVNDTDRFISINGAFATVSMEAFLTTGNTTIGAGARGLYYDPATTQATATITLPAVPTDGQEIIIAFGGTITSGTVVTTLTIAPNTGQTIIGVLPTTATVDTVIGLKWRTATNQWYRID